MTPPHTFPPAENIPYRFAPLGVRESLLLLRVVALPVPSAIPTFTAVLLFCVTQTLTKYGTNMSTVPMIANTIVLTTKYGKIMSVSPQINGTTALCFLPYRK